MKKFLLILVIAVTFGMVSQANALSMLNFPSEPPTTSDPYYVDSTNTFKIPGDGFQYILGKYTGRQAGAFGWYRGLGFSGKIEIPASVDIGKYGLIPGFLNPVSGGGVTAPEPTTILLLGFGLLGIAAAGRKKFMKNR